MVLQIVLTTAGIAEIVNAVNTGTDPVTIDAIGLGSGQYTPTDSQTALVSEVKQITTIAGEVVADDTIHVTIKDESSDAYDVGEFGLYTDSGTLLGVYSQPSGSGWILQKAAGSTLLLSVDIKLDSIDAASVTFGDITFSNPPATETVIGVIEIADATETQAATDDSRAMTPLKDKLAWNAHLGGFDRTTSRHLQYSGNLNSVLANSVYNFNTTACSNFPAGMDGWGFLKTMMHVTNATYATQLCFTMNSSVQSMWFRQLVSGTWGAWIEVMSDSKIATQAEAEGASLNTRLMTPLRTRQEIAAFGIASQPPTVAGNGIDSPNFNTLTVSGLYFVGATPTNGPVTGANGHLLVNNNYNGTHISQLLIRPNGNVYHRIYNSGWGSWVQIYTASDYSASFALNGYQKFPNGLIVQWGTSAMSGTSPSTIWFPITFPTACRNVLLTDLADTNAAVDRISVNGGSVGTQNFQVRGTDNLNTSLYFFATGY